MIVRVASRVRQAAEWFSVAMLAVVFVVTLSGVAARYLFNRPLAWSDELGMILLLWAVFIADAFVTRDADHIAFDVMWDRASPTVRRVMLVLQAIVFGAIFALALPTVLDYVLFLRRERTSALEWRLDIVFLCFIVYLAMLVVRLGVKLVLALGRNWRDQVADADASQTANIIG